LRIERVNGFNVLGNRPTPHTPWTACPVGLLDHELVCFACLPARFVGDRVIRSVSADKLPPGALALEAPNPGCRTRASGSTDRFSRVRAES